MLYKKPKGNKSQFHNPPLRHDPQWLKDLLQALPPPPRGTLGESVQTTAVVHTVSLLPSVRGNDLGRGLGCSLGLSSGLSPKPWDVWVSAWLPHKPCTG